MKKTLFILMVAVLMISILAGCASSSNSNKSGETKDAQQVELQFFQYKPEARDTFDKLIAKFEEQYPHIKVVQDNPPDASTVLKTKIAAGEIPDVIANGGDNVHAMLATSGVLADLSAAPELKNITESYIQILKDITGTDEVYAIPYGVNANGVIYNKALFKELGLTVPATWDEFVKLSQTIQEAGRLPFYFTFKDSWTTLPSFNAFGASTQGDQYFAKRKEKQTSFAEGYKEAAEKYLQFISFGQKDSFGKGYNDGNAAFANGESVMYAQGVWAISEIKKINPEIELGVFPYPVTNDPDQNKLISGVDQLLSISAKSEHPDEAKLFIRFLMNPDNAKNYVQGVNTFSAIKGVTQDDPSVAELIPVFEKGLVSDFPDHYIPSSMKLDQLLQELILKQKTEPFLQSMDEAYDNSLNR
ncbi:ABC transporter substrate-binding protein [Paenibacillus oenotherae]|uniref:ABC transporter substrate-binding protein n=1 Tax=Paenibacillus oenotherae TaxID=1435645 RepID=A0ABS7D3U3_9BACL|nr:ABC transporter substrate-binding protein [Paenibacillus oenotherae]MBW7474237.1 ABC transporter substrate-binding protein [Paenibacillus oenotherae]